jgi:SAM-dependent methyltransferase
MIKLARINNPTVEYKVMDCRLIKMISEKFDGIICGFCIPYLSAEDSSKLITDCYHLLNNNGLFYFSTIKGDYKLSGFEKGSTGDEAYVYYYNEDHFKKELIKNGFILIELLQKDFPKTDGTILINQIFIAQKNKDHQDLPLNFF